MAEAGQTAPKRTTVKGWFSLALIAGLLVMGYWGRAIHNGLLQALGFLPPLFALLIFMVRSDRRTKRDPEYARKLAETRQKYRPKPGAAWKKFINRMGWVSIALTLVVLDNLRKAGWQFGHLSLQWQITAIVIIAAASVFLISVLGRLVRKPAA